MAASKHAGPAKPRAAGKATKTATRAEASAGLPLDEALASRDAEPRCGLIVVNIDTGVTEEWLRFTHTLEELYDVAVLPGVSQPEMIGFQGDAIKTTIKPEQVVARS